MFMSRGNCGICVLALALALTLVGTGLDPNRQTHFFT